MYSVITLVNMAGCRVASQVEVEDCEMYLGTYMCSVMSASGFQFALVDDRCEHRLTLTSRT